MFHPTCSFTATVYFYDVPLLGLGASRFTSDWDVCSHGHCAELAIELLWRKGSVREVRWCFRNWLIFSETLIPAGSFVFSARRQNRCVMKLLPLWVLKVRMLIWHQFYTLRKYKESCVAWIRFWRRNFLNYACEIQRNYPIWYYHCVDFLVTILPISDITSAFGVYKKIHYIEQKNHHEAFSFSKRH